MENRAPFVKHSVKRNSFATGTTVQENLAENTFTLTRLSDFNEQMEGRTLPENFSNPDLI